MINVNSKVLNSLKNTAQSKWAEYSLKEEIKLIICDTEQSSGISLEVNPGVVQYFFCIKGKAEIVFAPSQYTLELGRSASYFLYNPEKQLNSTINAAAESKVICVFSTLEKIHSLFMGSDSNLDFLSGDNANKKYYKKDTIPPVMEVALHQLVHSGVKGPPANIYRLAKVLEILSLYFSEEAKENKEYCPYLNNEDNVRKIKEAKEILIGHLGSPPTIQELAQKVGLNEFRLKEGFKSLYGTTLFNYLLEYKMNKGRHLLDTGKMKVKEVAYDLGYTNPSHFISAFKNKFGVTPKKYIQTRF